MNPQPPRIAAWSLRHFGCSPNNDAVIGDLDERYRAGRSATWYWRQIVLTIVVSFAQQVWSHKRLTVRALITGWGVFVVSRYGFNLTRELLLALASWSRYWRHDWITISVQIPEVLLSGVLAGWLVARMCRQSQKAMVLAYATYFAGVQTVWLVHEIRRATLMEPFRSPLIYSIAFITLVSIGILIGGGVFWNHRISDDSGHTSARVG
jgi:hypothetical protein